MRAIVLSAGQGRRLLPLTSELPKCLLAVDGEQTVLEMQLRSLARCGISRVTVIVGFAADRVEAFLEQTPIPGLEVETLFNPFFATTDNLATCWLARSAMLGDFLLLNGDTLFEDDVLNRVLGCPPAPVSVTIDRKSRYDDDDMKVSVTPHGRLRAISKTLDPAEVSGESIGLLLFRGVGVRGFRDALDASIRRPEALRSWYLSVVDEMAKCSVVSTASIQGLWWREIDSPEDLEEVRESLRSREKEPPPPVRLAASRGI